MVLLIAVIWNKIDVAFFFLSGEGGGGAVWWDLKDVS